MPLQLQAAAGVDLVQQLVDTAGASPRISLVLDRLAAMLLASTIAGTARAPASAAPVWPLAINSGSRRWNAGTRG